MTQYNELFKTDITATELLDLLQDRDCSAIVQEQLEHLNGIFIDIFGRNPRRRRFEIEQMKKWMRTRMATRPQVYDQLQDHREESFSKIKTQMQLVNDLNEVMESVTDSNLEFQYNAAIKQLQESMAEVTQAGLSVSDLYSRFGKDILKASVLKARSDIRESEEKEGEQHLFDAVNEDQIISRLNYNNAIDGRLQMINQLQSQGFNVHNMRSDDIQRLNQRLTGIQGSAQQVGQQSRRIQASGNQYRQPPGDGPGGPGAPVVMPRPARVAAPVRQPIAPVARHGLVNAMNAARLPVQQPVVQQQRRNPHQLQRQGQDFSDRLQQQDLGLAASQAPQIQANSSLDQIMRDRGLTQTEIDLQANTGLIQISPGYYGRQSQIQQAQVQSQRSSVLPHIHALWPEAQQQEEPRQISEEVKQALAEESAFQDMPDEAVLQLQRQEQQNIRDQLLQGISSQQQRQRAFSGGGTITSPTTPVDTQILKGTVDIDQISAMPTEAGKQDYDDMSASQKTSYTISSAKTTIAKHVHLVSNVMQKRGLIKDATQLERVFEQPLKELQQSVQMLAAVKKLGSKLSRDEISDIESQMSSISEYMKSAQREFVLANATPDQLLTMALAAQITFKTTNPRPATIIKAIVKARDKGEDIIYDNFGSFYKTISRQNPVSQPAA